MERGKEVKRREMEEKKMHGGGGGRNEVDRRGEREGEKKECRGEEERKRLNWREKESTETEGVDWWEENVEGEVVRIEEKRREKEVRGEERRK